jgi:hypothetical protein
MLSPGVPVVARVARPQNKQKKISVRTETNWNKICFGCVSVCFGVSNLYQNNRNKQNCFVKQNKPNNPKFSEKYPNMLSFKLFGWVCFGSIETSKLSGSV